MVWGASLNAAFFFAVRSIGRSTRAGRKASTLRDAARHNKRAIQAELGGHSHIDPALSHLNQSIAGPDTPGAVVELAKVLMTAAGVNVDKLRKDYTQAVELLFSLPPDTAIDTDDYFKRCLAWAGQKFGEFNILSADIHRDEAAPHCHVLVLPLVGGRMCGSGLISRAALKELRKSFGQDVAHGFGLKEPPARMSRAAQGQAVALVLARLESNQDAILRSSLWLTIKRDIERDPVRFMAALGLELPSGESVKSKRARTMAEIFTSPGKGDKIDLPLKPIGFPARPEAGSKNAVDLGSLKPIGFDNEPKAHAQNDRNLSCVGFDKNSAVSTATKQGELEPSSTPAATPKAAPACSGNADSMRDDLTGDDDLDNLRDLANVSNSRITRERDSDREAGHWCEKMGEFIQVTAPASREARAAAEAWVMASLKERGRQWVGQ